MIFISEINELVGLIGGVNVGRVFTLYWDERLKMAEWWAGEIEAMRPIP